MGVAVGVVMLTKMRFRLKETQSSLSNIYPVHVPGKGLGQGGRMKLVASPCPISQRPPPK